MKKIITIFLSLFLLVSITPSALALDEKDINLRCSEDKNVSKEWKEFQNVAKKLNRCLAPYRYVKKNLTNVKPKSKLTDSKQFLGIDSCKLNMNQMWQDAEKVNYHINPNMVIQIIPFSSKDYPDRTNPQKDYKNWFNAIEQSLKDMTDYPSNYKFIIPNKYFYIDKTLKSYNVGAKYVKSLGNDSGIAIDNYKRLADDIIKVADLEVDFSKVDKVWFVGSRSSTMDVLERYGAGRTIKTNEKDFSFMYFTQHIYDYKSTYWDERGPIGDLHEMMHITGTTNDHYGDGKDDKGTGRWGNMSSVNMDFLAWDKWLAKFILDSQVICINTKISNTVWIKPSTISGSHEKLLLIPITKTKSIAVESIRASGHNFKLPLCQQGALVYTIDLDKEERMRETGLNVIPPDKPILKCNSRDALDNAILKNKESVSVLGYKITVIESGEFGDVVRVAKY